MGTIAAASIEAGCTRLKHDEQDKPSPADENVSHHEELLPQNLDFLNTAPHPKVYKVPATLQGRKLHGLFTGYTGIDGVVPPEVSTDYRERLAHLVRVKLERAKEDSGDGMYPQPMLRTFKKLFEEYDPEKAKLSSLETYRASIETSLSEVRAHMDLGKMAEIRAFKHFGEEHVALLKKLEAMISATGLLAYSVTELMPTQGADAPVGIELYDFLLRTAGLDFLERIPAEGDDKISLGQFQFTEFALYGVAGHERGASLVQKHILPKQFHIPGSVAQLRGADHQKAAHLFAIHNIAHAISKLSVKQVEALCADMKWIDAEDLVAFTAAAHNLPAPSYHAFEAYAGEYLVAKKHGKDLDYDLIDYIRNRSPQLAGPYAKKTGDNYQVLLKRFER